MEPNTFDDIIKRACTTRLTRLDTLRGLAAGAFAAVSGATFANLDADAKKKKRKSKGKGKSKNKKTSSSRDQVLRSLDSSGTCTPKCTEPTKTQQRFPGGPPAAGCFRIGGSGDKFQLPTNGCVTYTDPSCGCSTEFCVAPDRDGKPGTLSFQPKGDVGCTVSKVTVKGGTDQIVYTFDPATLCGSGLIAPKNNGGNVAAISHIDVCGVGCCKALKCASDGGDVVCTNGPICNNCGGTINCPCDDKNKCTVDSCNVNVDKGICVFTPKCTDKDGGCQIASCDPQTGDCSYTPLCPDKPGCTTSCKDGVCSYSCDAGCQSCTIGFYKQNGCRPNSGNLTCQDTSSFCQNTALCSDYRTGCTLDINKAISARGEGDNGTYCAQLAAAYLNQAFTGSCTAFEICDASITELTDANEGFGNEICPLNARCEPKS